MPARALAVLALLLGAAGLPAEADEARIGRFEYSVQAASKPELPKDHSAEWSKFAGIGAGSGILGAVAPPFYASGLVVGGLILLPGALAISERERRILQTLSDALERTAFPAAVEAALRRRGAAALPPSAGPTARVALAIQAFGLIGMSADRGCMVVAAELAVHVGENEVDRASFAIRPERSTPDAPPPQCAFLARFAEEEGRLVTDTAAEYAEVVAALAVQRLAALRKAPPQ